jgi:hypothetical protein
MRVGAIVEELERLGVELRAVGYDLEYEGPEEAISPELLERLKAHKADLVAIFSKTETVAEVDRKPAEAVSMRSAADPEAHKLSAAGWKPKERCGKTIWECPDNGFYYLQKMAMHFLDRGVGNVRFKSGANGRR